MSTATALCPFCNKLVSGEIATPSGTHIVDFADPSTFQKALDDTLFHTQMSGRPVIEHRCAVAGHQVWLYTDIPIPVASE